MWNGFGLMSAKCKKDFFYCGFAALSGDIPV